MKKFGILVALVAVLAFAGMAAAAYTGANIAADPGNVPIDLTTVPNLATANAYTFTGAADGAKDSWVIAGAVVGAPAVTTFRNLVPYIQTGAVVPPGGFVWNVVGIPAPNVVTAAQALQTAGTVQFAIGAGQVLTLGSTVGNVFTLPVAAAAGISTISLGDLTGTPSVVSTGRLRFLGGAHNIAFSVNNGTAELAGTDVIAGNVSAVTAMASGASATAVVELTTAYAAAARPITVNAASGPSTFVVTGAGRLGTLAGPATNVNVSRTGSFDVVAGGRAFIASNIAAGAVAAPLLGIHGNVTVGAGSSLDVTVIGTGGAANDDRPVFANTAVVTANGDITFRPVTNSATNPKTAFIAATAVGATPAAAGALIVNAGIVATTATDPAGTALGAAFGAVIGDANVTVNGGTLNLATPNAITNSRPRAGAASLTVRSAGRVNSLER